MGFVSGGWGWGAYTKVAVALIPLNLCFYDLVCFYSTRLNRSYTDILHELKPFYLPLLLKG